MKVGIVGAGAVASACAVGLVHRGVAREIVLGDRDERRAAAVARDMRYAASLLADVRRGGVVSVLEPTMWGIERRQFQRSVEHLKSVVSRLEVPPAALEELAA
jgi:malate/lactate dehydrogenase